MKPKFFAIAFMLSFCATGVAEDQESKLFSALGNAIYVSNAADLLSTEILIARGGYETNPALKNRAVRVGVKVIAPFVINHLTEQLYKHDQKKFAILVRIGATCAFTYVASRNLQLSYSISF